MDRDTPIILSDYIAAYLELPEQLGLSKQELSKLSGIDLIEVANNPRPFTINEVLTLIDIGLRELNMPYGGLAIGQQMRLTCHGMAGVSAMAQPTYAECLKAACRLCEQAFPPFSMEYFETESHAGIRVIECISLAPLSHFFAESIMVNFKNILKFLLGKEHNPKYVSFPYAPPSYENIYHRYFDCKIKFSANHTEFAVPLSLARKELLLANKGIARMAE